MEPNDTLTTDTLTDPRPSDDLSLGSEEDPIESDDTLAGTSAVVIVGNEEDNFILGFQDNDTLLGLGGNDVILGGDGDNIISGGSGDDVLRGGSGFDSLLGGSGDDVLGGDNGSDSGGDSGGDRLRGGAGPDIFLLQPRQQLNLSQFVERFEDFSPENFPLNRLDQLINNPEEVDADQLARFEDLNTLLEGNLPDEDEDEDDVVDSKTVIEDFDPTEDRLGLIGSLSFDDLEIRPSPQEEATVEIRLRDSGELLARLLSDDPQLAEKITEETVVALDVVQFTQERLELDEAGNPVQTVTLQRNRSSGNTIAVAITSEIATDPDEDSDNGESEELDRRWVLFGPTEQEKTVQLTVDESLVETVPEVNLRLETPLGGARLGPLDEAVLELFKPVEPTPSFVNLQRIRPLLGDDGTSLEALEVVLVRSGDLTDAAAVTVQLGDGTIPAPTSLFGSLRAQFEADRATTTVRIPLSEDAASLEQVRLSLAEPSPGLLLGDDRQTLFELMPMQMDPALLSFAESIFQVEEDGTPIMEVVLVRAGNLEQASQATITVSEGTLALPETFGERLIPVTFEPGEERQTITITGVQESDLAAPGTVNLSLSNPSPGTELIRPRTAILEVFEVEPPPPDEPELPQPEPPSPGSFGEISFTSANYVVDEDGTEFAEIGLQRRNGSTGAVGVTVIPFSQTAVAPADFDDTPIQVTFAEGQTEQVARLPIRDDTLIEPSETLGLVLANPTNGASLGPVGSATLTIAPSDVPATFSFEGVGHLNPVGSFYGAQGVQFSQNALALLSATGLREMGVREGFGGNFETAPSGETAVSYNQGDRLLLTVQEGFSSQLSFAYASPFQEHQVTVFSGPEGTGEVLARLSLAETPEGEFPRAYDVFETVTLPFAGVARSLSIGSVANKILLDDIVLG